MNMNKELKDLKQEISSIKHPRLNKILQSEKLDLIITKVQEIYQNISNKLIIKYNLEDELKQGKIFTILIAIIAFVLLIIVTVFSVVTLNSIIGIGLVFSFFRQIIFCFKWGYTIIKNKGKIIKKYLSNLFPNSKILQEEKARKNIPLYEEQILYQIEDFIDELNKSNIDLEIEKKISIELKKIVEDLNLKTLNFEDDYKSLEYKRNIQNRLTNLYNLYQDNINKKEKQEDFLELRNDVLEQIAEVEQKVYVKRKYPH